MKCEPAERLCERGDGRAVSERSTDKETRQRGVSVERNLDSAVQSDRSDDVCARAGVAAVCDEPARIVIELEERHGQQFEVGGHGELRELLQQNEEDLLLLLGSSDVSGNIGELTHMGSGAHNTSSESESESNAATDDSALVSLDPLLDRRFRRAPPHFIASPLCCLTMCGSKCGRHQVDTRSEICKQRDKKHARTSGK